MQNLFSTSSLCALATLKTTLRFYRKKLRTTEEVHVTYVDAKADLRGGRRGFIPRRIIFLSVFFYGTINTDKIENRLKVKTVK